MDIKVRRYPEGTGSVQEDGTIKRYWDAMIEPEDKSWILFIPTPGVTDYDGSLRKPVLFIDRDPATGAVRNPEDYSPDTRRGISGTVDQHHAVGVPGIGVPEQLIDHQAVKDSPVGTAFPEYAATQQYGGSVDVTL